MSAQFDSFIQELRDCGIFFTLSSYRYDAISVLIDVPGEHWEVDFLADGTIDVERFVSNGEIKNEEAFADLFARFDDRKFADPKPAKSGKSQVRKHKRVAASTSAAARTTHRTPNR